MSYSGDPSSSLIDAVRFHIGDTDTTNELFSDTEITYMLSLNNNAVYKTAYNACIQAQSRLARLVNESVGSISISYSDLRKQYEEAAKVLRNQMMREGDPVAYAGGIEQAEKDSAAEDTSRVEPKFYKDMEENQRYATSTMRKYGY